MNIKEFGRLVNCGDEDLSVVDTPRCQTPEQQVCKIGQRYNLLNLKLIGYTKGDGSGSEGYNWQDYFPDGVYLGPDEYGIEPIFDDVAQQQCDMEYVSFLEARRIRLENAIREACYYLSQHAPGRAYEVLNQALTGH